MTGKIILRIVKTILQIIKIILRIVKTILQIIKIILRIVALETCLIQECRIRCL